MSNTSMTNTMSRRIKLLLQMEWSVSKRNLIVSMGSILAALLTFTILTQTNTHIVSDYPFRYSYMIGIGSSITYLAMAFMLFWITHQRINNSNTITYTQLPSTTLDKLIVILIEGLVLFAATILINQLVYSIEVLLYPSILDISKQHLYEKSLQIGNTGYQVLVPFMPNSFTTIAVMLFFLALALFCTIRFRRFATALFVFIFCFLLLILGIDDLGMSTFLMYSESNIDLMDKIFTGLIYLTDFALIVASYLVLQKRQIK